MADPISILVASGKEEDRNNITAILQDQIEFTIVSEEKDETGAIIRSERLKPAVIIINFEPELASLIKTRVPSSSIIFISETDDIDFFLRALKAGVTGFLNLKTDKEKLSSAVKIVSLGGFYISELIALRAFKAISFIRQFPGQLEKIYKIDSTDIPPLSPAEREIITCITKGMSDNKIAEHLNYSGGTIRNILSSIGRKTKLRNRTQIAVFSLIYGLINLDFNEFIKIDDKDISAKHDNNFM